MSIFTEAEFRALMPDMDDDTTYSTSDVTSAIAWFESLTERVTGTTFWAASTVDTLSGTGCYELVPTKAFVLSVTSVVESGTTLSGYTYTFDDGVLRKFASGATWPSVWTYGIKNIVVTYQAGYSATAPEDLKQAGMIAVRDRILSIYGGTGIDDRATSTSSEVDNMQMSLAGTGRPTGIPLVDEVLLGYADRLDVFGFA